MSIAKFNRWQWSSGQNRNHLVQATNTVSSSVSGALNQGIVYQIAAAPGTNNQFTSNPTNTEGLTLLTTTFQPKYADSWILLQSTNIDASEVGNPSDDVRIFAHAGSTLLGVNRGSLSFESFRSSSQCYNMTLMVVANSWGTDSRTIRLGISSTNNSSQTANWYINNRYDSSQAIAPYSLTIMEIAK
jgi:hypothetical protein